MHTALAVQDDRQKPQAIDLFDHAGVARIRELEQHKSAS